MAKTGIRKISTKVARRRLSTRTLNSRRRRATLASKTTTLNRPPSLVSTVRSILSYLPGQSVIKPLADFIFKGFGYTASGKVSALNFSGNVSFVGLYAKAQLRVSDLIAFERSSVRSETGEVYDGASFKTKIQYVKLMELELVLRNTTPSGKKTGNWSAFIRVFKHVDQLKDDVVYSYKDICEMPGAKTATASENIVIKILNFPPHWYCGRELELSNVFATVHIGFEDLNRINYVEFTSDDFSCSGTISAKFKVLGVCPGESTIASYYDIKDCYSNHDMTVVAMVDDKSTIMKIKQKTLTATNKDCTVTGTIVKNDKICDLSQMELE